MGEVLHTYKLMIAEKHLDTFGHVNNAVYLELLEEARWDLITSRGFGLSKIQKTGLGPVILEIHMKFKKELTLRTMISIETKSMGYKSKIGTLSQVIKNEAGDICFEATLVYGLFDTHERKLVAPTKEWLFAVGIE